MDTEEIFVQSENWEMVLVVNLFSFHSNIDIWKTNFFRSFYDFRRVQSRNPESKI